MMKMVCDGCLSRGIDNDLTGREIQAVTVQLTPAEVIHLCPDGCSRIYFENKEEVLELQSETIRKYHEKNATLKAKLWEMFKNAEASNAK